MKFKNYAPPPPPLFTGCHRFWVSVSLCVAVEERRGIGNQDAQLCGVLPTSGRPPRLASPLLSLRAAPIVFLFCCRRNVAVIIAGRLASPRIDSHAVLTRS